MVSGGDEGRDLGLLGMRSAERGTECHSPEKWTEFAAGILPAEEARLMMNHAAYCDVCGQELKCALEDLQADPSDVISDFSSPQTDSEFPRRMASTLVRQSYQTPTRTIAPRFVARWAWAAAAAVLVVSIAATGYWLMRNHDPGTMLAQAAAQERQLPLRIPETPYAPVGVQRSSENGNPAILVEAEATILRGLERDPGNVQLLQYKSRVELLRNRYRSAISVLSASADDPRSRAGVLVDLGTAWLAQGLASQRAEDLQRALSYLSDALEQEPVNLVARFNHAIAAERLSLLDSAETDWGLYLEKDSSSGWAGEARANLERVRQKKTAGAKP